jgi:hypothetical protein
MVVGGGLESSIVSPFDPFICFSSFTSPFYLPVLSLTLVFSLFFFSSFISLFHFPLSPFNTHPQSS